MKLTSTRSADYKLGATTERTAIKRLIKSERAYWQSLPASRGLLEDNALRQLLVRIDERVQVANKLPGGIGRK